MAYLMEEYQSFYDSPEKWGEIRAQVITALQGKTDAIVGNISIHHLQPDFFFGFEIMNQIKIATPEKALIDVLYLTSARSRLFKTLPEVEFPTSFSRKKADAIIHTISSPRIKTLVQRRLVALLRDAE